MLKRPYVVICLFGIIQTIRADSPCIYKECDCEDTIIMCRKRGLKKIPDAMITNNSQFQMLDLDVNMITSLPSRSLPSGLQVISLMDNPVTTIDDAAFNDCANTVQTLTFSNALFTRVPDAFLHLKQLRNLNIYETKIKDWNPQAMNSFGPSLQKLDLVSCGIMNWPNWLKNFTNLTELTLSDNFISSVPDDALDSLANSLTSLSLQNNSLTSVPKTLSKLNALTMLNLQANKISDVSSLPSNSKLTYLSLNYNNIYDAVQLSNALLPYANSLYHLDIDNNRLTAIPDVAFLTSLSNLDFSNNRMSDSLSGSVPSSTNSLNLGNNAFRLIPRVLWSVQTVPFMLLSSNQIADLGDLSFPPWMVGVEQGYNLVVEITDSTFPENSSLENLNFNNNPLSKISDNAFKNLPGLSFLNLQNTLLTRLPLGLASAARLRDLELGGSMRLVCTCKEKNLEKWIMSLPEIGVNGDCGPTSILTFYKDYSPLCPRETLLSV